MIRKNGQQVEVENEGLVVFLFDETHGERIVESEPCLLEGFRKDAAADPPLGKLARQGTLVAYEKLQDDDLRIEVIVGKPLTKKELAIGSWQEPQRGFLRLPSGRLRVDSYNSLALSGEEPNASGGIVCVKPGDYVVTLYRLDLSAIDDEDLHTDDLPSEVVVLTNARKVERPSPVLPILVAPCETTEVPEWVGAYEVEGAIFRGLARFDPNLDAFFLNLNPAAAAALDLRAEMRIRVEIEGSARTYDAVYLGEEAAMRIFNDWKHKKTRPKGLAHASWVHDSEGADRYHLTFQAFDESFEIEDELRDRWIRATAVFSG